MASDEARNIERWVETENEKPSNLRWWILITVIFGTFLGRLDQTVVNLALPKIISDYGITVSDAAWISTAYILANAVFVPVWGKLGDTAGRKRIYLIGFIGFIIASGLCAVAWNLSSMIVFRVIQGFAVSADYPTAMAIIAVTFRDLKERAQALGIWSSAFAAASVFGPLIGGPLIDSFNWRAVFFINIPLGLVGLFLAITFINESVGEKRSVHFDWWGSAALGASLGSLTMVLDQGQTWGWGSVASIFCYILTIGFGIIFYVIEINETEPIVNLKFFESGVFVNTLLNNFIVFMGLIGAIFLVPIFAETFLGYDATQTGYLFIPLAIGLMIAAPLGGRLIGKAKPSTVIFASTFCSGLAMLLLAGLDPRWTALQISIPLSLLAFSLGFGMAQRTNLVAVAVPQEDIGEASAVLALVRNISGAFGVAIFSTLLTSVINAKVLAISHMSSIHNVNPTTLPVVMQQFVGLIILKAQVSGYAFVFEVAAITIIVGSFFSFLIRVPKEATAHGHTIIAEG
ncbi:MAG TPA: DHA2 family efflux MFS transporter permease subunit [Candidatus Paceibacterota bacterium]|nr:DHA2 family efflux MFS transporter permease subunit [Candidatus Paceibacterota bacterium]